MLRSRMEARALALFTRHQVPAPACNTSVFVDGSRYEIDMLWPAASLAVELDSRRHHSQPSDFERDRLRHRELLLAGYRVMPVTWAQLKGEPDRVVAAIRRILRERSIDAAS
jgi:very-short-patch-repair endonuclease